jgi:hypothetical protein
MVTKKDTHGVEGNDNETLSRRQRAKLDPGTSIARGMLINAFQPLPKKLTQKKMQH